MPVTQQCCFRPMANSYQKFRQFCLIFRLIFIEFEAFALALRDQATGFDDVEAREKRVLHRRQLR